MLNPKLITIGKLKLAYKLSQRDVDDLMDELLPDRVFPLVVWETAYNDYWLWSLKSNALSYGFDIPQLPDTSPLPEKHFTYSLHSNLIERFFGELIRKAKIDILKSGLNYIIECAYENGYCPFEDEKNALFSSLYEEEVVPENRLRTSGPLVINFCASTYYGFISDLLFDSVAVDKTATVHYFSVVRNYPFIQEVKGITQNLVDRVIQAARQKSPPIIESAPAREETTVAVSTVEAPPHDHQNSTLIPRVLWEKKDPQQVCDDMRVAGHTDDAPIAHVLYYWVGIKNFTEIGTILRGDGIGDSARQKHARKKLREAKGRYHTE